MSTLTGDIVEDLRHLCDDAAALADRVVAGAPASTRTQSAADSIRGIRARLDEPLRVAIAGRIKAGKSTLLNALVGERLAATDAAECTRVITVFHHAERYELQVVTHDGDTLPLGFRRVDGRLVYDLGGLAPADIIRLEVGWPSPALRRVTLIDTPGLGSMDDDNSRRTVDFLESTGDSPTGADAVIYLMRHLHRSDTEFLGAFMDRTVAGASPVNAIAVLSRADEIGACRPDALASSARIAERYRRDATVSTLVADVLPLAGLIAETGLTLHEHEYQALARLARLDDDTRQRLVRSVDDLIEPSATELTVEIRRDLIDRFGLFGIRVAIDALAGGHVTTSSELSRFLVDRSGLDAVRHAIDSVFLPRAGVLQARTALVGLRAAVDALADADPVGAATLRRGLDELAASTVEFARLQAAHAVMSGAARVPDAERAEVEFLLTASEPSRALGLDDLSDDDRRQRVLAGIERWRTRASDPLADPASTSVAETLARIHEQWWRG